MASGFSKTTFNHTLITSTFLNALQDFLLEVNTEQEATAAKTQNAVFLMFIDDDVPSVGATITYQYPDLYPETRKVQIGDVLIGTNGKIGIVTDVEYDGTYARALDVESISDGICPGVVRATMTDPAIDGPDGTFQQARLDKTFNELYQARLSGHDVIVTYNGMDARLTSWSSSKMRFEMHEIDDIMDFDAGVTQVLIIVEPPVSGNDPYVSGKIYIH